MGFFDSYPVRIGFGFVPKLTCLIYIYIFGNIRHVVRFDPLLAALFPWFFVCWFSVPFFTPLAYVWMISTFGLLPCHTSSANIGCQQKTLGKKKVWGSKGSLLSSKAYTSLSFGRCEVCFFGLVPSGHGTNSTRTMTMIPAISEVSICHTQVVVAKTVLLMTRTKCVKILTRTLRTFVKLLPDKISDIMKNHRVLEKSFLQQQEDTINRQSSTCDQ